jgi:hypothetical protein
MQNWMGFGLNFKARRRKLFQPKRLEKPGTCIMKHEVFFSLNREASVLRPFRVRLARTPQDVKRVIGLRPGKYAKRAPEYLDLLQGAEEEDMTPESIIVFAEDVNDRNVLGTLRLQFNLAQPLKEQGIAAISEFIPNGRLMGISRLTIVSTESRSEIKFALFKAATKLCQALQANWMIVTALPPMDVQFVSVMAFKSLLPPGTVFSEPGSPDRKFNLLGLDVSRVSEIWGAHDPELRTYMLEEYSPEIDVFSSLSGIGNRSRKADLRQNPGFAEREIFSEILL